MKCETCHEQRLVEAGDIRQLALRPPLQKQTYLGLPKTCTACHFDEHRKQFATSARAATPRAAGSRRPGFNHAKTSYPLTGKH